MSKIICDVCGTAYPETAAQCPICGYAKPDDAQASSVNISRSEKAGASTYTYVKGGRFSKANVRKRNQANQTSRGHREEVPPEKKRNTEKKSNAGLTVVVIILLLAIVATAFYIGARFLLSGRNNQASPDPSNSPVPTASTEATNETASAPEAVCTDLILSDTVVELDKVGAAFLLNVTPVPENTVDVITYASSDPAVATVSADGRITAVAPGQAAITITCGSIVKECQVNCTFEIEETEEPTQETDASVSNEPFELNREDITMSRAGETWQLYDGAISKLAITWTSDNPSVATIEGGLVTAVGSGMTEVHGEYNGQVVTCIIRCSF